MKVKAHDNHPLTLVNVKVNESELEKLLKYLKGRRRGHVRSITFTGGIPVTIFFRLVRGNLALDIKKLTKSFFQKNESIINERSVHGYALPLLGKVEIFPENIFLYYLREVDSETLGNISKVEFSKKVYTRVNKHIAHTLLEEIEHCYQNLLSWRYIRYHTPSRLLVSSFVLGIILYSNVLLFRIPLINTFVIVGLFTGLAIMIYQYYWPHTYSHFRDQYEADILENDAHKVAENPENINFAKKAFKLEILLNSDQIYDLAKKMREDSSKFVYCPHCGAHWKTDSEHNPYFTS